MNILNSQSIAYNIISFAIQMSSFALVRWFLDHKASPNVLKNGRLDFTPLSFSARYATLEITELLIARGADVTYGDVLHEACASRRRSREEMAHCLLKNGAPVDALRYAICPRRIRAYEMRHEPRETPLHLAITNGRWNLVAALLEHGARWDQQNSLGTTAKDYARHQGRLYMIEEMPLSASYLNFPRLEGEDRLRHVCEEENVTTTVAVAE